MDYEVHQELDALRRLICRKTSHGKLDQAGICKDCYSYVPQKARETVDGILTRDLPGQPDPPGTFDMGPATAAKGDGRRSS